MKKQVEISLSFATFIVVTAIVLALLSISITLTGIKVVADDIATVQKDGCGESYHGIR